MEWPYHNQLFAGIFAIQVIINFKNRNIGSILEYILSINDDFIVVSHKKNRAPNSPLQFS